MDYLSIKKAALQISDRTNSLNDNELDNNVGLLDTFLRIIESKMNRYFRVQNMSNRVVTDIVEGQFEYDVPDGFIALKSIKVTKDNSAKGITLNMVNNQTLTNIAENNKFDYVYNITGNTIRISPIELGKTIEIDYYGRIIPLTIDQGNWISDNYPDAYIFGLLTEINAYVKDANASALWGDRFKQVLDDISYSDHRATYSGTTMQIMVM